jgi:hypothetical protein
LVVIVVVVVGLLFVVEDVVVVVVVVVVVARLVSITTFSSCVAISSNADVRRSSFVHFYSILRFI